MALDLEQLRIFIAVAEYRSFTRAAEAMYISHSTTSRNVAALEDLLGVQLLIRDNRSVHLTPAGEMLYRDGTKLIRTAERVEDSVRSAGTGFGRSFVVATAPLSAPEVWESVNEFCGEKPAVRVGLLRRDLSDIWKLVDSGEADLGVTISSCVPENLSGIERLVISRDELCLMVNRLSALAGLDRILHSGISDMELVCESGTSRFVPPELRSKNSVYLMPSFDSIELRVKSGSCAAVVPRRMGETCSDGCALVPLVSSMSEDVIVFWLKGNQSPSLAAVLRLIKSKIDSEKR